MSASNLYAFFGRQGSGKSTQAKLLASKLKLPYFNTGNQLRQEVADDSSIGRKIANIMQTGALVDDQVISELFEKFISDHDTTQGFVVDGFPRNEEQYQLLVKLAAQQSWHVIALEIAIAEKTAYERIGSRVEIVNGRKVVREDDKPEIIKKRLANYQSATVPLLKKFAQDFSYLKIDGEPAIEQVFDSVLDELAHE